MQCRLIVDGPGEGAWNMAVDEAVLEAAIASATSWPTLRFYRWREPTVSLGYFQSFRDCPPELSQLPMVRRLTSGGAIVHDQELTYSVVFPPGAWPRETNLQLVRDVHRCLVSILTGPESLSIHPGRPEIPGQEPFLCFLRRSSTDVVAGADKILGSAQRSRRGALLQHGSILLRRSAFAQPLAGLLDRGVTLGSGTSRGVEPKDGAAELDQWATELTRTIAAELSRAWDWELEAGQLSDSEAQQAQMLRETKYTRPAWNERR